MAAIVIGLLPQKSRRKVNGRVHKYACGGADHVGKGKTYSQGGWESHIGRCPVAWDYMEAAGFTPNVARPTASTGRAPMTDEESLARAAERAYSDNAGRRRDLFDRAAKA